MANQFSRTLDAAAPGRRHGRGPGCLRRSSVALLPQPKPACELLQCVRSMTDPILHILSKFGEGLLESSRDEQRIVSESPRASRLKTNRSLARSVEQLSPHFELIRCADRRLGLRSAPNNRCQRDDTAKTPRPLFRGHIPQEPEQLGIVVSIGSVLRTPGIVRRKTRRVNAGRSAERIHLEPGIVGENKNFFPGHCRLARSAELNSGEPFRQTDRLLGRVAGEGMGIFDDLRCAGKVAQRSELEAIREHGANLIHLMRVARGQNESCHRARTSPGERPEVKLLSQDEPRRLARRPSAAQTKRRGHASPAGSPRAGTRRPRGRGTRIFYFDPSEKLLTCGACQRSSR